MAEETKSKWLDGLPKSILHRIIWVVLVAIATIAYSYYRNHSGLVTLTALYVLVAVTCVLLIQFAVTGKPFLSRLQPETNFGNVEAKVRVWLDNFHISASKETTNDSFFVFHTSPVPGRWIDIQRSKAFDRYVSFSCRIAVGPADEAKMRTMNSSQIDRINSELTLEILRSKISNFSILGIPGPFREMNMEQRLPITPLLTEEAFMATLFSLDNVLLLMQFAVSNLIEREVRGGVSANR